MPFPLDGFEGFVPFADVGAAPAVGGVYVVVRPSDDPPVFLPVSPAGRWKDRDPSLPVAELEAAWVPGEPVLYIGKADPGATGRRGLRQRLIEYRRFGQGLPVPHSGGRMIWQLADHDRLLVAWRAVPEPAGEETAMLGEFHALHHRLPFANRRR